jgi:Glyoxalase/Bleomycin resistance protein/Dioxygenase superfamily
MADQHSDRPPVWTGHLLLSSSDPINAARFYEKLGMRPVQLDDTFCVLELRGGTHLAIRLDRERAADPAPWDLMVDDLDATHDQWDSVGIPVSAISPGPPHRSFEVTDPDGHGVTVRDSHVIGPV